MGAALWRGERWQRGVARRSSLPWHPGTWSLLARGPSACSWGTDRLFRGGSRGCDGATFLPAVAWCPAQGCFEWLWLQAARRKRRGSAGMWGVRDEIGGRTGCTAGCERFVPFSRWM